MNSAGSSSSTSSDFLTESVYHNVRNIFTTNLLSQMAFVVDKMSLRNAAASLVTFCGKTCAYAFCFCPGVADILVRLWNPSLELMKRVLEEFWHELGFLIKMEMPEAGVMETDWAVGQVLKAICFMCSLSTITS